MLTTRKLKSSGIQRLSHHLTLSPLLRMQLLLFLRSYLPTLFQCVSMALVSCVRGLAKMVLIVVGVALFL